MKDKFKWNEMLHMYLVLKELCTVSMITKLAIVYYISIIAQTYQIVPGNCKSTRILYLILSHGRGTFAAHLI